MTHDTTSITLTGPTTEGRVAHLFGLRGDTWMRHANPRSVWTRFTCVSLVVIAVWSRVVDRLVLPDPDRPGLRVDLVQPTALRCSGVDQELGIEVRLR